MKYISTRGTAPALNFEQVVLAGLASDGGLYVPENIPKFSDEEIQSWVGLDYPELFFKVVWPYVEGEIEPQEFKNIIAKAYSGFRHEAIAPLQQLAPELWVMELFHGPTLAFKDFALQFLGLLLDYFLKKNKQRVVIVGATSGDTGSAAIEGCRQCENLDIFILHPHQRVSEVQRRQMTTVDSDNVFNLAINGDFDDCQNLVKALFRDQTFLSEGRSLVAVNSINWARIMAQIVYYFHASLSLGGGLRPISFSVPTGNFGDIYAGYLASKMGLAINQLIIATNANDILHRCISNNDLSKQPLKQSLSPSMDIMVSSNFERLLFDLYGNDGAQIAQLMDDFDAGQMKLSEQALKNARQLFSSFSMDDQQTLSEINNRFQQSGYLMDPHTAIGVAAGRQISKDSQTPMVCLATAHPAKFPEAVKKAGSLPEPRLPIHMAGLFDLPERFTVLEDDANTVRAFVQERLNASEKHS